MGVCKQRKCRDAEAARRGLVPLPRELAQFVYEFEELDALIWRAPNQSKYEVYLPKAAERVLQWYSANNFMMYRSVVKKLFSLESIDEKQIGAFFTLVDAGAGYQEIYAFLGLDHEGVQPGWRFIKVAPAKRGEPIGYRSHRNAIVVDDCEHAEPSPRKRKGGRMKSTRPERRESLRQLVPQRGDTSRPSPWTRRG